MEQLSLLSECERTCDTCGIPKPLEAFNWANRAEGKRQTKCRDCFRVYNKARYQAKREQILASCHRYHWANRERILAANKERYRRDIEASRAAGRARAKYQNARPERKAAKLAWAQRDRLANPQKWREKSRRDYARDPQRRIESQNRRRAIKRATALVPLSAALLDARWMFYAGLCWMCGEDATEWDHVKPLAKGGAHMLCNLRPACRSCNAQKSASWPLAA